MARLLDRIVVPVATVEDAQTTATAIAAQLAGQVGSIVGIHVIEKGGGVPDKAPLEAREAEAQEILESFTEHVQANGIDVETEVLYGTDVIETVVDAVDEEGGTAVVFCPRHAGLVTRLLTGDRSRALLEAAPVPVISLPSEEAVDG